MPIKQKNVIKKFYTEIPKCSEYLISNYGEVIKFSTGKKMSNINNCVRITIGGKQTTLSVVKLLRELFIPFSIPICYTEKNVMKIHLVDTGVNKNPNWKSKITSDYVKQIATKVESKTKKLFAEDKSEDFYSSY
jgi:hypothetical protein